MARPKRQNTRERNARIRLILTLSILVAAWILGAIRAEGDLLPAVQASLPEASRFERIDNGLYEAWGGDDGETLVGYVAVAAADGYGGPLTLAVAADLNAQVLGVTVVDSKETPAWLAKAENGGIIEQLIGKLFSDPFELGNDVDVVTGATYTSRALAQATLAGSQAVARALGLEVADTPAPKIQFGIPEAVLLGLFGVGFVAHRREFKYKKQARWGSMLTGLIVLGFVYNSPLTLAYFAKLFLGYWPAWQTNLYWYFLLGGIFFVFSVDNKNPYCEWFCPFGAAQEVMGAIGGAKARTPRQYREPLAWVQRGMSLTAIAIGLYLRSPGLASYEIFGTLFSLVGSSLMFALLGIVLLASLYIKRPWCNYLCPLHPIETDIRTTRAWVKSIWQKIAKPRARTNPA